MMQNLFRLVVICLLCGIGACAKSVITFTGANLPPTIKTISIANFYNETAEGPANIAIRFTEELKEYFQRNTKLILVNENGDIQFEGRIINYQATPLAPQAGGTQSAALQRLTIGIEVQFTNTKEEKKDFKQVFSFYQDFSASQTLREVEQSLIPIIFEQIIFDIFNKSVANW
ncbi:MAG: LPS assembly lipoprotein LptE [Cytophagales bacterium]|nr:LPS assembly lipoprotein LptE [Cytophagales bacterium]MDW8384915.1 LptE family protein [Flammeovirgaceae bacterium]